MTLRTKGGQGKKRQVARHRLCFAWQMRRMEQGSALGSHSEVLASLFPFPADPLDERPVQLYGPLFGAVAYTKATVPAFLREEDNGRVLLYRVGDQDIHWADLNANVAA